MTGLSLFGSPTWARTRDLRINSPALYRLSYRGINRYICVLCVPTKNPSTFNGPLRFWLPDLGSNQGPTD
ncbi:hypothetical protein F01_310058 [Burkholderia cenocepacia]|nr:hypothetical protein F01_310058 [Burkholderia cenocepacia]